MGANILADTDGGLLTPQNCAVVFIAFLRRSPLTIAYPEQR
jgi:hypothetical protein